MRYNYNAILYHAYRRISNNRNKNIDSIDILLTPLATVHNIHLLILPAIDSIES
jgi:hypothetical protein